LFFGIEIITTCECAVTIQRKISVIGLGYVGLPVAMAFSQHARVIGFDINTQRIMRLKNGIDDTNEVSSNILLKSNIEFTTNAMDLRGADFHIISVPTPIDKYNQPNLEPLLSASQIVGKQFMNPLFIRAQQKRSAYPFWKKNLACGVV
jgi:UDP-N-acetyl-D-mannosaminuronate dehydrogenase